MIQVEEVSKTLASDGGPSVRALDGVSLDVRRGSVIGVLGPNGAGKTTLFRIIAGLLRPSGGRVSIMGHDVVTHPLEGRASLGLLTEEPGLPGRLDAHWHVALHASLRGMPRARALECSRQILQEMGLGDSVHVTLDRLSKGNRLKVALARALVHRPAALLLDEPSANLDIETSAWLRSLVRRQASQGCGALVATHNPGEAEEICDEIVVLGRGRVLARGTPEDLKMRASRGVRLEVRFSGAATQVRESVGGLPGVRGTAAVGDRLVLDLEGHSLPAGLAAAISVAASPLSLIEFRQMKPTLEEAYHHVQARRS